MNEEANGHDLLIVMGTALAVFPFCFAAQDGHPDLPRVLINFENTKEAGYDFDNLEEHPNHLFLKGNCHEVVEKLCKDAGWANDLAEVTAENIARLRPN